MNDQPIKDIVTVSEMARMLGLSRARFYQLLNDGIFPRPSRNTKTKRPFLTREQQQICLGVRRSHCGVNGKPVLFYASTQPNSQAVLRRAAAKKSQTRTRQAKRQDPLFTQLRRGLMQLGLAEITDAQVQSALVVTQPDGHSNTDTSTLLMDVFGHLSRQNSQDNVAR